MIYLGIDPGLTGGLAYISPTHVEVVDMPVAGKDLDLHAIVKWFRRHEYVARATIERAQAMPKQGVSSVFRYGEGYGSIKAALAACEIPFELVSAAKWRTTMVGKGADKEASRAKAIQLFPQVASELKRKKDHGRAEALLIAEYGRRYVWADASRRSA